MISAGLISLAVPFLDGNMFSKVTMSCNSALFVNSVKNNWRVVVTTSCALLNCLYGSFNVPNLFIFGTFVQMCW